MMLALRHDDLALFERMHGEGAARVLDKCEAMRVAAKQHLDSLDAAGREARRRRKQERRERRAEILAAHEELATDAAKA